MEKYVALTLAKVGGPGGLPPRNASSVVNSSFFPEFGKSTFDIEFPKVVLIIPLKIVTIISRSTHLKELWFTIIKKNTYCALCG